MPTTLNRQQRLKSELQISQLLKAGNSIIAYPLRICYLSNNQDTTSILVRVPKKLFKRAVKRNLLKRRIREAYRLNQDLLESKVAESGKHLHLAFTYIAADIMSFAVIQKSVIKAFNKIIL